jgi:hypothetical protein
MGFAAAFQNCTLMARAFWSVSTSHSMPRYPEYVRAIKNAGRGSIANPRGDALEEALLASAVSGTRSCRARVPWLASELSATRLLGALSSFTDDYEGAYPAEFFPEPSTRWVFDALSARYESKRSPLTVPEQFECALGGCLHSAFGAAATLHALTRVLARGRDERALPSLAFSLAERIELGKMIAPFARSDSRGGDPLGDTYHYWAMVMGGLWCADPQHRFGVERIAVEALLRNGSRLMWLIRDRLFGNTLFFGRHVAIDRMGFRHGTSLGLYGEDPFATGRVPSAIHSLYEPAYRRRPKSPACSDAST